MDHEKVEAWYDKNYKWLFVIPTILIILSVGVIAWQIAETGDFVNKGISLSGGVSATVTLQDDVTPLELEEVIQQQFPQADLAIRSLTSVAGQRTFVIDAGDIAEDEQEAARMLTNFLENTYTVTSVSTETTGPSLGEAFFIQTIIGILLAFLWMGWVVYLYFGENMKIKILMALLAIACTLMATQGVLEGTQGLLLLFLVVLGAMAVYFVSSVPGGAVILAAASTVLFTLAAVNLIGMRLSTAGVAAFLMIIGYSVDTDILLSTRVLKSKEPSVYKRIWDALSTGMTMQVTTTTAVFVAFILASSEVIEQIMLIILIGMVGDIIFTWFQNAGILYWFAKKQKVRKDENRKKSRKGRGKGKGRKKR